MTIFAGFETQLNDLLRTVLNRECRHDDTLVQISQATFVLGFVHAIGVGLLRKVRFLKSHSFDFVLLSVLTFKRMC